MEIRIETLEDCDLSGTGLERMVPPGYAERAVTASSFDTTTLFYNAVWCPGRFGGGSVAVLCPRLLNLEPFLTGDGVTLDGVPVRARRVRHHMGSSIVWYRAPQPPREIAVVIEGQRRVAPVAGPQERAFFADQNTLVTASKNNELDWIEDFMRYHRVAHGLQAVLFFDNASDAYGPEDVADALKRAGIERAVVMRVPKPWGVVGQTPDGQTDWSGLTLQLSLLNLARLRFLGQARAVLNCDIDELVWNESGSIFDRACRSPLGFVQFRGEWRLAEPRDDRLVRHVDHRFRFRKRGVCPSKWCLNPRGPLGGLQWEVHRLAARPFMQVTSGVKGAGFWHCRAISKNWKATKKRSHRVPKGAVEDLSIPEVMAELDLVEPSPQR